MCWELDLHTHSRGSQNHSVVIHTQPFLGLPITLINSSEHYQGEGKK